MIKVSDLFDVRYGVNLELNKLELDSHGVNFVSRTAKNNGVSARVKLIEGVTPLEAGLITVAGGGSVLETFLQPEPFYSGRDLYYLRQKVDLTNAQKLYYCLCIRSNKYRYNYGRQANRTLGDIVVPIPSDLPKWVSSEKIEDYSHVQGRVLSGDVDNLQTQKWKWFRYDTLFEIKKGKRLTKQHMVQGETLFIGSTDTKNGLTARIGQAPIHSQNTISISYNGSVAEAFYQPEPYWATDDVNVLYPKFSLNPFIGLFLCTVIKQEKYRYNYGRKWHLGRMNESLIKLPATTDGTPDWRYMENYVKHLHFSAGVES